MVKYLVKDLKADIGQLGLDWNGVDYLTISPLVSAILYDSSSQQNIINYLMDQDAADESSVILNSVKSSNIPLQEKTDILEFAGAAYILRAEEEDAMEDCYLGRNSGLKQWPYEMNRQLRRC